MFRFANTFPLVCLLFTGCQTMPQRSVQAAISDPSLACLSEAFANPQLQILNSKLGSVAAAGRATIQQLASNEKPTAEEKVLIGFWGAERQRCMELGEAKRRQYPSPQSQIFEAANMKLMHLTAKLYAGNITYGEFNVDRNNNYSAVREGFANINEQQKSKAEEQRRRDAAELQLMLSQQQQTLQANRPTYTAPTRTTCTKNFNQVDCVTQ
jgi:hypothetical protein